MTLKFCIKLTQTLGVKFKKLYVDTGELARGICAPWLIRPRQLHLIFFLIRYALINLPLNAVYFEVRKYLLLEHVQDGIYSCFSSQIYRHNHTKKNGDIFRSYQLYSGL